MRSIAWVSADSESPPSKKEWNYAAPKSWTRLWCWGPYSTATSDLIAHGLTPVMYDLPLIRELVNVSSVSEALPDPYQD